MTTSRITASRRLIASLLGLYFLLSGAAISLGLTEAGQIIALSGRVVATDANQAERVLAIRSPVYVGDHIQTKPGGRAQVFLLDDTTISLGEESYMVIDEYVYAGKPQEDSSSMRFLRGVIRNVTGRITAANPSRFHVKTGKAVIGVRGCDILFDIQPDAEKIHVLELPPGRQITVDAEYHPQGQPDRVIKKSFEIKQAGYTVLLLDSGEARQTPTSAGDIRGLMRLLDGAPQPAPASSSVGEEPSRADVAPPPPPPPVSASPLPGGAAEEPAVALEGISPIGVATTQDTGTEDIVVDRPWVQSEEELVVPDPQPTPPPSPPKPEPTPEPIVVPDPQPDPAPGPVVENLVQKPVASGMNWNWGVWGTEVTHKPQAMYLNAHLLPPATVDHWVSGVVQYNLQGVGRAGAIVFEDRKPNLYIEGNVTFHLTLGNGLSTWNGLYSLGNSGGDSLSFTAGGTIHADHVLHGQAQNDYALVIDGRTFCHDTLVGNSVNGNLLGNPNPVAPVTGAAGRLQFDHGPAGPKIDGVYGVDFTP